MRIFTLTALSMLLSFVARAEGVGVGFMLGETTGLTAKSIQGEKAWDAGLGWSLGANNPIQIHADHLWTVPGALYYKESQPLDLYFGAGGRMKFADEINLGLRLPIGLATPLGEGRSEFFGEVAPIFDVLPELDVEAHVMVGLRFYL